jgi:hypothetical protein
MDARSFAVYGGAALLLGGIAVVSSGAVRLPGDHRGFAPAQPIAFSHRLHAGELEIQCLYCHSGAEKSRHAGIPEASVCMNCHRLVTAARDRVVEEENKAKEEKREPRPVLSPEIAKLYRALALDDKAQPDPKQQPTPIEWVRVHRLPDFVYFDHRPHVMHGVACETCHGPVQSMDRVAQIETLNMGWCLQCHRSNSEWAMPAPPLPVAPTSPSPPSQSPSPPPPLPPPPPPRAVSTDCASCHF